MGQVRTIDDIRAEHRLYNEDHRYCTFCEQEWPCDANQTLVAYDRLRSALRVIVAMDYRGNEPGEQQVARRALAAES